MSSKAITRCSVRSQRPPAFGRRDERQGGWQREELKAGYQPVTRSPWERVLFSWDGCSDLQPHLQALTSCSCWGLDTPISPSPLPLNLRLRTEGRYADVRLRRNGDYLPFTTNAWRESGVRGSFESLCCEWEATYDGMTPEPFDDELSDPLVPHRALPGGHPARLYVLRLARRFLPIKSVSTAGFQDSRS